MNPRVRRYIPVLLLWLVTAADAQQAGSIRGMVYDKEFEAPLAGAEVVIVETGDKASSGDAGNYLLDGVAPGTYTLVFTKQGYVRQVKGDVTVSAGRMSEVDVSLSGEFVDMEEFVVQDLTIGGATEIGLLNLRMESPALLDSIGSDLMSRAGASDAASALRLVSGATVAEGKYAVIRGLPDRYVSSQMNGVRLPTADADKRAVQLDQFPAAVIESIQVSKTFTPDQQGDASGGAVNVVLKGIPDESLLTFSVQSGVNTQVAGNDDFLTSRNGGVSCLGYAPRDVGNFAPDVGVSRTDGPMDYKWSFAAGGKRDLINDFRIGGFASLYYEKDSSFYDDGIDDAYWVTRPGDPLTPQYSQGSPRHETFKTSLFDVTHGSEEVQWGGLGVIGVETEGHSLDFLYMYTRAAEYSATLAEDTRGKKYAEKFYAPDEPPLDAAPYLRTETLDYTERTTQTAQLRGEHVLPIDPLGIPHAFMLTSPEVDWTVARSTAGMNQPDKRQFGALWHPEKWLPATWYQYKPAANTNLGNFQRIWKEINEESSQYFVNVKFPFEQWSEDKGYVKVGIFDDHVDRQYEQESFGNFTDPGPTYEGSWSDYWTAVWGSEDHPMIPADIDVDYEGRQDISAWYYMADVPLSPWLSVIGGVRHETTELEIEIDAEENVTWIPPGLSNSVKLTPGAADVAFKQTDALPAIGFVLKPVRNVKLRGSYTETVARQTFKELTPIQQMEYLGGDVFIGNPGLKMSALKNYDLRLDYTPYKGGLVSVSWFHKSVTDPIEYVQRLEASQGFTYTTPVNYPEGWLRGWEFEVRQQMGRLWDPMDGLTVGANATVIDSEVTLPKEEAAQFDLANIRAPMKTRDMMNAPQYLYNLFFTYDWERYGLQFGVFYTVEGDTLIAGAGQSNGKYVPNVYKTEHGKLNVSVSKKIGDVWKIKFQAKNLTNPEIQTVYRSDYSGGDKVKSSYREGMEFSLSAQAKW